MIFCLSPVAGKYKKGSLGERFAYLVDFNLVCEKEEGSVGMSLEDFFEIGLEGKTSLSLSEHIGRD